MKVYGANLNLYDRGLRYKLTVQGLKGGRLYLYQCTYGGFHGIIRKLKDMLSNKNLSELEYTVYDQKGCINIVSLEVLEKETIEDLCCIKDNGHYTTEIYKNNYITGIKEIAGFQTINL